MHVLRHPRLTWFLTPPAKMKVKTRASLSCKNGMASFGRSWLVLPPTVRVFFEAAIALVVAKITVETVSSFPNHSRRNGCGHGHVHCHCHDHGHGQLQGRNTTTNARRLLRRSYLGRAAAGEPPSCGSRYCCVDEKGQGRGPAGTGGA